MEKEGVRWAVIPYQAAMTKDRMSSASDIRHKGGTTGSGLPIITFEPYGKGLCRYVVQYRDARKGRIFETGIRD